LTVSPSLSARCLVLKLCGAHLGDDGVDGVGARPSGSGLDVVGLVAAMSPTWALLLSAHTQPHPHPLCDPLRCPADPGKVAHLVSFLENRKVRQWPIEARGVLSTPGDAWLAGFNKWVPGFVTALCVRVWAARLQFHAAGWRPAHTHHHHHHHHQPTHRQRRVRVCARQFHRHRPVQH
jgi:hypothetical protein